MANDGKQSGSKSPHQKLEELAQKLEQKQRGKKTQTDTAPSSAMALGMKYAVEFSAAVMVGAFLGWCFDKFFKTAPWGLIAGLFLGVAAGVREIVRSAKKEMETPQ